MKAWPLEPLQRKRQWETDLAREALARRRIEWQASAQAHAALLQELDASASMAAPPVDVQAHGRLLHHLLRLHQRIALASQAERESRRLFEAARDECLRLQCQLDTLASLLRQAQGEQRREMRRREQKEADASWLARVPVHQGGAT